jgi:ketopantoate reductase
MILSLPRELVVAEQSKVTTTRTAYNALSQTTKDLVTKLPEFLAKKLKWKVYLIQTTSINEAIANMPRHITNDYVLPTANGITWAYRLEKTLPISTLLPGLSKISYAAKPTP